MKTYHLLGAATSGQFKSHLCLILAGLCSGAFLFAPTAATALTVVTTTADSGAGSLRNAVNSEPANGTITFAANLSGQTILLTSGSISVTKNVTINAAALPNGIAIDGNHASRIFDVVGTVNVVLNSLTITNGYDGGGGGAIACLSASLTLNNCKLVNNQCAGYGGALWSTSQGNVTTLTLNGTTVSGNTAGNVSAIYLDGVATTTLNNCTISGNSGGSESAVEILGMRLGGNFFTCGFSAVNSTFSGNVSGGGNLGAVISAFGNGGAVSIGLTSCTVVSNTVTAGGGPGAIYLNSSLTTLTLNNSIVSANTLGGVASDISGSVNSSSAFNLIGVGGGLVNGVNNNLVGITNPLVAPLGNYGGPTQTMPPLPDSPALNAGSSGSGTDQRGLPRLSGSAVDIGAVEFQFPTVVTLSASGVTLNAATLNGSLSPSDLATAVYFQYGLTTNYGSFTATNMLPATNVTLLLSNVINGLTQGTTYYYQLVGSNSVGTVFGAQATFTTTTPVAPIVTTLAASSTSTSAILNGAVSPNELAISAYFRYGPTTNYGSFTATNILSANNVTQLVADVISGLTLNTTYYYQLVGSNSIGTAFGAQGNFTTIPTPPTVTTLPASSTTATSAILNGTVNPNAQATSAYFEYGLTTSYGSVTAGINLGDSNSVAPLTAPISVAAGMTYHFRAVASNADGLAYGADSTFSTPTTRTFTGAASGQGLDLQGSFLYAVNVGNNGAPGLIGDANFTADTISGVTITTPGGSLNTLNNWANPNFGATTDGLRLTQVMSSIRWTGVPGTFTVNLSGLQVGTNYQLQLLFLESLSDRVFNVTVNGTTIVPNFRFLDYGPFGTPIVISYAFTAASNNALIQLGGGVGGNDNNPHICGFTLETLLPATTPTPSVISSVTQSGTNLIFAVTNGVPGTGWTCLTTTNLAPPIIWSTNRTGTFDGQGNVTLTNGILSTEPARYFIIRTP